MERRAKVRLLMPYTDRTANPNTARLRERRPSRTSSAIFGSSPLSLHRRTCATERHEIMCEWPISRNVSFTIRLAIERAQCSERRSGHRRALRTHDIWPKSVTSFYRVSDVPRSREWYMNKLGFTLERELEQAVGIKDESGLTIFLVKATDPLAGQKITLTIQIGNVDGPHHELTNVGVPFVSPPRRQFWGYGAEVLDPTGT